MANQQQRKFATQAQKMTFIFAQFLFAAEGAGMTERRSEKIYNEIVKHYDKMNDAFPDAFMDELAEIMAMPVK